MAEYNNLCPFCVEINNPDNSIWNSKRQDLPLNRIIYENEHWKVMPPLGSFMIGGLLILSKAHYRSCSVCPQEVLDTLDDVVNTVAVILQKTYNKNILFFEHGPSSSGSKGACCVDHAHLNVFPIQFDIWSALPAFTQTIPIHKSNDILAVRDTEYIWLFDSEKNYAYPASGAPSQYIRSLITKDYGFPERWNWQDYLGLDEIKETMDDLAGAWHEK